MTAIVWYLTGFAGGRIPGKYDSQAEGYRPWYTGRTFKSTKDGITFITFFNPLSKGYPYQARFYGDSIPMLRYGSKRRYSGAIDSTGKMVLPAIYNLISPLTGRLWKLRKDSLFGVFDCKTRKIVLPVEYLHIEYPHHINTRALVLTDKESKSGLADSTGTIIIPCKYKFYYTSYEHIAFHNGKDSLGRFYSDVYDYKGRLLIAGKYESVCFTQDEIPFFLARNKKEGYYIDKKTLQVRQTHFLVKEARIFSDSTMIMTAIYPDSIDEPIPWGDYIYRSGDPFWENPPGFRYGLTDLRGNVLLPFTNDSIAPIRHKYLLIIKNEKSMGLMDKNGRRIIPLKPHRIKVLENLPLIEVSSHPGTDKEWKYYTDSNGIIILSSKAQVIHISQEKEESGYILFHLNNKLYKLTYNEKAQRFEWSRKRGNTKYRNK